MTQDPWNPNDYAKQSQAQLDWANAMLEQLPIQTSDSLLDIGCGDGKITAELAKRPKT